MTLAFSALSRSVGRRVAVQRLHSSLDSEVRLAMLGRRGPAPGPRVSGPPVSGPVSGPRVSGPGVSGPPVSGPTPLERAGSDRAGSKPAVSNPPVSAEVPRGRWDRPQSEGISRDDAENAERLLRRYLSPSPALARRPVAPDHAVVDETRPDSPAPTPRTARAEARTMPPPGVSRTISERGKDKDRGAEPSARRQTTSRGPAKGVSATAEPVVANLRRDPRVDK